MTTDGNRVQQIECGNTHSLVLADNGRVYGFGDNSVGQIDLVVRGHQQPNLTYRQAHRIGHLKNLPKNKVKSIYASEQMSAIKVESHCDGTASRKFYAWGDKNMIDVLSRSSTRKGSCSESFQGATANKYAAYARGGQPTGAGNLLGTYLLDQRMDGKQPYNLYLGHTNAAILQERFSEAIYK